MTSIASALSAIKPAIRAMNSGRETSRVFVMVVVMRVHFLKTARPGLVARPHDQNLNPAIGFGNPKTVPTQPLGRFAYEGWRNGLADGQVYGRRNQADQDAQIPN